MVWSTGSELGAKWSSASKSMGSECTCGCRSSGTGASSVPLCECERVGEGEECEASGGSLSLKSSVIETRSLYHGRQDVKGLDRCLVTLLNLHPHAGQTSLFAGAILGI